MKTLIITSILAFLIAAGNTIKAQDEYLGLPGDNLNLYAVMNLFQESETLEAFERNLNDENSRINNLDLNGDNLVDYITVTDYPENNVHNIVLRVALSPREKQDVAVFTVQRMGDGSVQIQLIGDEDLYGRNYIVEPIYDETPNPGYAGRRGNHNVTVVRTTPYEIAAWPLISFIFSPRYVVWHSSWDWGYYPVYWNPWRPFYYHEYYGYHYNYFPVYYRHYHHWNQPRYTGYHDHYYNNIRSHSSIVRANINNGHYKTTYSRPESRRDGEALYARTHSSRSSNTVTSRRSGTTYGNRAGTEAGSRRSGTTADTRTNSSTVRGEGTSRRSSTVNNSRNNDVNTYRRPEASGDRPNTGSQTSRSARVNNNRENNSSDTYRRPAGTSGERSSTGISNQTRNRSRSESTAANRGNDSRVSTGSGNQRRSSSSAVPRSSSRSEQARPSSARTSPGSSSANRSERRTRSNNSNTETKKDETSRDSGNSRQSRR